MKRLVPLAFLIAFAAGCHRLTTMPATPPAPLSIPSAEPVRAEAPPPPEPVPEATVPEPPASPAAATHTSRRPSRPTPAPPVATPAPSTPDPVTRTLDVPSSQARLEASLPPGEKNAYRLRAQRDIAESRKNIDALKQARLTADQQTTLRQAQKFLLDAQQAMKDGDVQRAATLAEKSRLLSGELRKRTEG